MNKLLAVARAARASYIRTLLVTSPVLLVLAELLAFTRVRILSLGLILFVIMRLLPYGSGFFTKLVVSFGTAVGLVTGIATVAWAVHVPLSSGSILSVLFVLVATTYFVMKKRGIATNHPLKTNAHDIASAIVAAAAVILVMWPVLQESSGARLAMVITGGGDNTSHLEMVKINDLNHGLPYGTHNRVNNKYLYASYPQGWHFNVVFLKWLTEPFIHYQNVPRNFLLLFYVVASIWLGMLMFLMARVSLMIAERLAKARHALASIAVVAVCTAVGLHWILGLFTHGFQAQIASFVVFLLEVFFLIEAFERPAAKRYPALLWAMAAATCINFMWVFIVPVTFGLLGIAALVTIFQNKRLPPWYVWLGVVVLGAFASVQPLLYKLYPLHMDIPLVMQRGDVQQTSMYSLLFMAAIIGGYAAIRWGNRALRVVLGAATIALAYCLYLFFDQLNAVHELRYFYFKATYLFIMLGALILGAVAYEIMARVLREAPRAKGHLARVSAVALVVLALGAMVTYQVRSPYTDQYAQSTLTGIEVGTAWPLINAVSASPENGYYTVFLGACDRGSDIRASQLTEALAYTNMNSLPTLPSFNPGTPEESDQFKAIKEAILANSHTITIVSSDQVVENHLRAYLGDQASKAIIVSLDTTPETEPISQCPNRTRDLTQFPIQ
jgi:hypothetical protein